MKRLLTATALLIFACLSASATTNITTCYTISTVGDYAFTSLSSISAIGGGDCIVIAGITGTGTVNLDCANKAVIDLNSTHSGLLFYIHDNSLGVAINLIHCYASLPSVTAFQGGVEVYNSNLNWTYGGMNNMLFHFSGEGIGSGSGSLVYEHNTSNTNAQLAASWCPGASIKYNTFNGYTYNTGASEAIVSTACDGTNISSNTITGYSTTQGLDDGILLGAGYTGMQSPITNNNVISKVWDAGIEVVGEMDYWQASYNNISEYGRYGIAGFWYPYVYHGTFTGNDFHDAPAGVPFSFFVGIGKYGATTGVYYLDVSDTTYDGSNTSTIALDKFGVDGSNFGHLTFYNNNFGVAEVYYGGYGSGVTDNGGNYCGSATDSQLTCH